MERKVRIYVYPLLITMVFVLLLINSCKKDDNDSNNNNNNNNPPVTVTDVDGNVYQTVTIGTQVWMLENLKTTRYNDGSSIPLVTDNTTWAALATPAFCWYSNDSLKYKSTYGALYKWYAIGTGKLCPTGWHVPADSEWTILTTYLGGIGVAGEKLKETGTSHWRSPNSASNSSGFTALPAGYRDTYGGFSGDANEVDFWSSTSNYGSSAWYYNLSYNYSEISRILSSLKFGFSVRCVRN